MRLRLARNDAVSNADGDIDTGHMKGTKFEDKNYIKNNNKNKDKDEDKDKDKDKNKDKDKDKVNFNKHTNTNTF